ncbi:PREDICTED: WAP four-disulfide core domain protein 5 [Condylura cristata]|uniref:WAP four-disulfide core domain protein 5 n=1 Tax=Condylura cristata TaxID=143302 RepID=UPI000642A3D8|nr:PREDICTED: WAP four-disulfide core domain protein 5 [Condylura cristata]
MTGRSLLLLVALLALGSQLPAASGRRKKEKAGGCPPDEEPCLLSVPDQCADDSQCPSGMKCCSRACFRQCLRKVAGDADCPGSKRCCRTACGRDCRSPRRGWGSRQDDMIVGGLGPCFQAAPALPAVIRPPDKR